MMHRTLLLQTYLEYQKGCGLSESTVKRSAYLIKRFFFWLAGKDIRDAGIKTITAYRDYLAGMKSRFTGKPLKQVSINLEMITLKGFFEYLVKQEHILLNPLEGLNINLKANKGLRSVFSEKDIGTFLDNISINTAEGQRDRALFELMYSSGLRVSDVLNLKCEYLNLEERIAHIRRGKGKKDRYVPFSRTAQRFLLKYMNQGRKQKLKYIKDADNKSYVFLGLKGSIRYWMLHKRFQGYLGKCRLENKGYTMHSIRHATGTHLLTHGASIRYVQELLGHEDLKTTQLYTRPTVDNIKAVYRTYHPRENEYYKEVSKEYIDELKKLKSRLEWGRKASISYARYGHKRGFRKYLKE